MMPMLGTKDAQAAGSLIRSMFDRWLERRRTKKLEQAEEVIEDERRFSETKQAFDSEVASFNATPPKELIEAALEAAGLPGDISQVQGRYCVYSLPQGGAGKKGCLSGRIEGIGLKNGNALAFSLSSEIHMKYPHIWFENNRWWTWYEAGDRRKPYPVHDFMLV